MASYGISEHFQVKIKLKALHSPDSETFIQQVIINNGLSVILDDKISANEDSPSYIFTTR